MSAGTVFLLVWAALLVGFLVGCFWAGRRNDEPCP